MLIRAELWQLLTETEEKNGRRLITWQEMGRRGLYKYREIVIKLIRSYGAKVKATPEGLEIWRNEDGKKAI